MKANKIHVSYFDYVAITKLEIDQEIGEHAKARIRGSIRDEDVEEYRKLLTQKIWVTITAEDEQGEKKILMTGIIAEFSLESLQHVYTLELLLKSGTYLMEGRNHFRSFQNQSVTCLNIMEMINKTYGESGVMAEDDVSTAVDFLLQYRETDWEFIKRVASRFGLAVTPEGAREGVYYYVGNLQYATYEVEELLDCRSGKFVDAFMQNGANGTGSLKELDYIEYRLTSREIYRLWDFLTTKEQSGHIYRVHSELKRGEMIHTYWLRPAGRLRVLRNFNECQQGCAFAAEIKAVAQDKVQISLLGDENGEQNITRWFPYSTGYSSPDGAGWYCMPEVGDRVRLQIPDVEEENGYVISAVHMDTDNGRKIPDHKSFKTRYGKELLFTPDSLELTNNKGMSVKIVDGDGIQIMSDKDITIVAGGNMTISSQEDSLIVAGTESVDIRQSGAGLHMAEDIVFTGGKFRIQ